MTLIVEDGTGVTNAEAWANLTAFDAWAVKFHGAASTKSDALREAGIRRGVAALDVFPWKGTRAGGRTQATSWPRTSATDADGVAIGATEIPKELILAQHMMAWAEIASAGILNPLVNMANGKTLTKVDGIQWTSTSQEADNFEAHRTLVLGALDRIVGLMTRDIRDVTDRPEGSLYSLGRALTV